MRRKLEVFAGFKIHKTVRLVPEVELPLLPVVGYMEKQYFMFVVFQVLQSLEQFVSLFLLHQIGKQNDQRTFVYIFGNHVYGINRIGFFIQLSLFLPE